MKWLFKICLKIIEWVCIIAIAIPVFIILLPFYLLRELLYLFWKPKNRKDVEAMTGIDYEIACANRLATEGYRRIKRTPASGDFGADIIAVDKKGRKVCFQCKKYKSNVGVSAIQEVHASKAHYNAQRAVVLTTASFTVAARKLAHETGVELVEHYYPKKATHWVDQIEEIDAMIE
jgi:restriction system protein|nr:MAG TPA: Restriction endonuclease [Caudoviricetes sp.]